MCRSMFCIAALALCAVVVHAGDADKWKPGLHEKVPTSEGFDVGLFIPDVYAKEPARKFPIIFMHDPGGNPQPGEFRDWANHNGVILIGINGAQNGPTEPITVRQEAALKFVEKELRLSDCLRFSMGMSGGAQMSWGFCVNHPDKHAGILMMGQCGLPKLPPKHVAVAYIHGDKEPNLPFINEAIARLKKAGNPLREIVRPGGHIPGEHSDQEQMLTWMFTLERYTHPKRSPDEIKDAKKEAIKRIEGLSAINDPGARFNEADQLLAIPDVGTWPEAKTLAATWCKAAMDKAAAMANAVDKHEFLTEVSQSPHLRLVPSGDSKQLPSLLADLRKDPAVKKEYEAGLMLQQIAAMEAQAKNKSAWQQVLSGYEALKARYGDTRVAQKAEEGIKRANAAITPPKQGR
ncbi:MAG: hypothetical protein NTW87_07525 [Planctomycetota bacterium]|nr:hypothetical protein [Planctomycetota bacterium]